MVTVSVLPVGADSDDCYAKVVANDGAAFDYFGNSVAISGTTAIVGAVRDADNGSLSGSAYLFDTRSGQQIAKLLPDDGGAYRKRGEEGKRVQKRNRDRR